MLSYIIPGFEKIFEGFGEDLLVFTRFVIMVHNYYFVLAILGIVGNLLIHQKKKTAGWVLVIFSGAMAGILIPLTIIAMYLSIFEMGKVVTG